MRMPFIMLSLMFLSANVIHCQTIRNVADTGITVHVEKQSCRYRGVAGSCLVLHLKRGDSVLTSKRDFYTLKEFTTLPDAVKLMLVEKLLAFKGDTAMVGMPMERYQYEGVERTCREPAVSKRYTIQLEALYLINKLCYPRASSFNFCYPVLYDAQDNREINDDPLALQEAYKAYESWFQQAKEKGVIEGPFPFNEGQRYRWLGYIERLKS